MKNHFKSTAQAVSKSEFAAMCNVHPSAVTRWIAEGKIGPEAIEGEGRSARIRAEMAMAQVRARSDIGQRLGNGLHVRLRPAASAKAAAPDEEQVAPDARRTLLSFLQGALGLAYELPPAIAIEAYDNGMSRVESEQIEGFVREGIRREFKLLLTLHGPAAGVTFEEIFDEARFSPIHWDAIEADRDGAP